MANSTAQPHKESESNKYFAYLSLCSIAACVVVRAPTIFDEGQIPIIDLKLKLNAGYILVFGPLLIVCAIAASRI
jgi:hypothetical protein